jgi:hypothetical protein
MSNLDSSLLSRLQLALDLILSTRPSFSSSSCQLFESLYSPLLVVASRLHPITNSNHHAILKALETIHAFANSSKIEYANSLAPNTSLLHVFQSTDVNSYSSSSETLTSTSTTGENQLSAALFSCGPDWQSLEKALERTSEDTLFQSSALSFIRSVLMCRKASTSLYGLLSADSMSFHNSQSTTLSSATFSSSSSIPPPSSSTSTIPATTSNSLWYQTLLLGECIKLMDAICLSQFADNNQSAQFADNNQSQQSSDLNDVILAKSPPSLLFHVQHWKSSLTDVQIAQFVSQFKRLILPNQDLSENIKRWLPHDAGIALAKCIHMLESSSSTSSSSLSSSLLMSDTSFPSPPSTLNPKVDEVLEQTLINSPPHRQDVTRITLNDSLANAVLSSADSRSKAVDEECKVIEDKSRDAVNAIISRMQVRKNDEQSKSFISSSSNIVSTNPPHTSLLSAAETAASVLSATLSTIKTSIMTEKEEDQISKQKPSSNGVDLFEPPISPRNIVQSSLDKLRQELASILSASPVRKPRSVNKDEIIDNDAEESIEKLSGLEDQGHTDMVPPLSTKDSSLTLIGIDSNEDALTTLKHVSSSPSLAFKQKSSPSDLIKQTTDLTCDRFDKSPTSISICHFKETDEDETKRDQDVIKDIQYDDNNDSNNFIKESTEANVDAVLMYSKSPLSSSSPRQVQSLVADTQSASNYLSQSPQHTSSLIIPENESPRQLITGLTATAATVTSVSPRNALSLSPTPLTSVSSPSSLPSSVPLKLSPIPSFSITKVAAVSSDYSYPLAPLSTSSPATVQLERKPAPSPSPPSTRTRPLSSASSSSSTTTTTTTTVSNEEMSLNSSLAVLKATLLLNDPDRLKKALANAEVSFESAALLSHSNRSTHFTHIDAQTIPEPILRARKIVAGIHVITTALLEALKPPVSAVKLTQAVDVCRQSGLGKVIITNRRKDGKLEEDKEEDEVGEGEQIINLINSALRMQETLSMIRTDAAKCIEQGDGFSARTIIQRLLANDIGALTTREIALTLCDVSAIMNETTAKAASTYSAFLASELIRLSSLSDKYANTELLVTAFRAGNQSGVASATFRIKHSAIVKRLFQFVKKKRQGYALSSSNYDSNRSRSSAIIKEETIEEDDEEEEQSALGSFGGNLYATLPVHLPIRILESATEEMNQDELELSMHWDAPQLQLIRSSSSSVSSSSVSSTSSFSRAAEDAIWGLHVKSVSSDISRPALNALRVALSAVIYANSATSHRDGALEALCKTIRVCKLRSELRNACLILLLRKIGWGESPSSTISLRNDFDDNNRFIQLRAVGVLACCLYYFSPSPSREHDIERAICAISLLDTNIDDSVSQTTGEKRNEFSKNRILSCVPALRGGPKGFIPRTLVMLLHMSLAKASSNTDGRNGMSNDKDEEVDPVVCAQIAKEIANVDFT